MIDFIMKLKNTPIAKTYENAELASIIPFYRGQALVS